MLLLLLFFIFDVFDVFAVVFVAAVVYADVFAAVTVAAADLLGQSDSIGSIEVGKLADIVAVDGDPTQNIADILKMKFVMRDGKVYKQD